MKKVVPGNARVKPSKSVEPGRGANAPGGWDEFCLFGVKLGEDTVKLKCPTCKKMGDWFAGQYGPFCSKRCKMVDLGKWFTEEHVISSPIRHQDLMADSGQEADETK